MEDHADMHMIPASTLEWKGLSWLPPGPQLATCLSGPLNDLTDAELVEVAATARRQTSWAQSRELAAIAELSRRREQAEQDGDPDYRILSAHESVCQEVSAALTITADSAATLIDLAGRLAHDLPDTRQALQAGRIDLPRARVIAELSHGLTPELCERLEERTLPTADRKTTGQLRRQIRRIIHRLAPAQLQQRKREAVQDRCLGVWDQPTGTTDLSLTGLDTNDAHAIFNKITAAARGVKANGDTRTLHQIRADLAQQLLHGADLPHAIRALLTQQTAEDQHSGAEMSADSPASDAVAGTLAQMTGRERDGIRSPLAHETGTPAAHQHSDTGTFDDALASDVVAAMLAEMTHRELDGIRAHLEATGRTHALRFRITRAVQDLHDRLTPLRESWCQTNDPAHGHTSYRPTAAARRAVQARYATCAFPTCNRRSERCDLDHVIPWRPGTGGPTCQCNLAPLCRRHHRTKQTPGWKLTQPWPGLLIWTTPSGTWRITLPQRE